MTQIIDSLVDLKTDIVKPTKDYARNSGISPYPEEPQEATTTVDEYKREIYATRRHLALQRRYEAQRRAIAERHPQQDRELRSHYLERIDFIHFQECYDTWDDATIAYHDEVTSGKWNRRYG